VPAAGSGDRDGIGAISLDEAVAFRIHRTNRLLRTHLSRFLAEHGDGITPEQWFVLARLSELGKVRQVDLAEPALGDPPNVSRLVDGLAARGLVERASDPTDRRSWLVGLTGAGRALVRRLRPHVMEERERVFANFSAAQQAALVAALDRLDDNLRRLL
jgi:DNA-binding MarR family transcriptional regulator